MTKKIGVFGGSFNPVHYGHLKIAKYVLDKLELDEIIFIPVFKPYHRNDDLLDFDSRVELMKIAFKEFGEKKFRINCIEKELGTISYTIRTLESLKEKLGEAQYFEIIGEDSYNYFTTWKDYKKLLEVCSLVVLKRKGDYLKKIHKNILFIENEIVDISATKIRFNIQNGDSIHGLLPQSCIEYIREKSFWRS